jgi:acetyl-CoA carboxylase biotin carboxylase subunit
MFRRILVANRGEIALRVFRACRELGVESVAVYSEADRDANYLKLADDAICIGPPASSESYLDIPRIISAAEIADVEAIHPGYGFLAENSHFAEVCESCNIEFIGPTAETISLFGNKSRAKEVAREAGVPVIPGSGSILETEGAAVDAARAIGYPIMLKAALGGGGRGMRVAHNDVSLVNAYLAARAEAESAFGDPSLYLERLVERARHVEVQVLADNQGNVISLGERDCSVQRRHQKLIEESPSPAIDEELRERMGESARNLCKMANYRNAGTVEFLFDEESREFYFMEMNARIQVEHPVTEAVTGIDLVASQIRVASGENLPLTQDEVRLKGHAVECRINAEDPAHSFRPSPGLLTGWVAPGGIGVRVDTHAHAGYTISPYYDSMIAKLVVYGDDRDEALRRTARALDEFHVEGVATTIPIQREIVRNDVFRRGRFDTSFLENYFGS